MSGPFSSYSAFVIHISSKVDKALRIDPPIHAECIPVSEAKTLTSVLPNASADISFYILALIPGYIVLPPAKTMLRYSWYLMSKSHFIIEWLARSWIPDISNSIICGLNITSGPLNRSSFRSNTLPSGSSYEKVSSELFHATCNSSSKF